VAGTVVAMICDSAIDRLVDRQRGAVSRPQLRAAGVNMHTIDSWVRRGRLRRVRPVVHSMRAMSLATRARQNVLVTLDTPSCGTPLATSRRDLDRSSTRSPG
jgi:hypothetical protein